MKAMESAGYDEMVEPQGLKLTLYSFQRQTLQVRTRSPRTPREARTDDANEPSRQWMYDRETQPLGLNALFWEERPSDVGKPPPPTGVAAPPTSALDTVDHTFWYNAMAGELRASRPPVVVPTRAPSANVCRLLLLLGSLDSCCRARVPIPSERRRTALVSPTSGVR